MIEVFKTTVADSYYAGLLIARIEKCCPGCRANFDLSDCDRILRVQSIREFDADEVISVVRKFGYKAEILPDLVIPQTVHIQFS